MKVVCCGECMIELSMDNAGAATMSFGGDTLNTAVYLARLGVDVSYVTALGDDPFSNEMEASWQAEGINTEYVHRVSGRLPGIYTISTDENGERAFHYWRDQSPVRDLFQMPEFVNQQQAIANCDYFFLSGITVALFARENLQSLLGLLDHVHNNGAQIVFDSNFRPACWESVAAAKQAFAKVLQKVDIAMPTRSDEEVLYKDSDVTACVERLLKAGIAEMVIKSDIDGCYIAQNSTGIGDITNVPVLEKRAAIDTTGAGDAFNAAYLAARLAKHRPASAARLAHQLAAEVIMHPGGIIPSTAMPELNL